MRNPVLHMVTFFETQTTGMWKVSRRGRRVVLHHGQRRQTFTGGYRGSWLGLLGDMNQRVRDQRRYLWKSWEDRRDDRWDDRLLLRHWSHERRNPGGNAISDGRDR